MTGWKKNIDGLFRCGMMMLFGGIVFFLLMLSIFSTSYLDKEEHTYFLPDNLFVQAALFLVLAAFIVLLRRKSALTWRGGGWR